MDGVVADVLDMCASLGNGVRDTGALILRVSGQDEGVEGPVVAGDNEQTHTYIVPDAGSGVKGF